MIGCYSRSQDANSPRCTRIANEQRRWAGYLKWLICEIAIATYGTRGEHAAYTSAVTREVACALQIWSGLQLDVHMGRHKGLCLKMGAGHGMTRLGASNNEYILDTML